MYDKTPYAKIPLQLQLQVYISDAVGYITVHLATLVCILIVPTLKDVIIINVYFLRHKPTGKEI